ncbi:hypothetical protein [Shewanella baltica]|uniref:hypothetical protein n=1 Tax=Shewanella baltica TaxID=62322 RepID=UPI00217E88DD|nr:hypothetical protein [Shewanella baltica]MCS6159841.1 hypothetical protein [Shewanella baltica]
MIQIDKIKILKYLSIVAITFTGFIYVLAGIHAFNEILGGLVTFKDFMSIVAQVATAGTLIFVVYQYKATSLKNYDAQLVEEAKSVVIKMNKQIASLAVSKQANIENLLSFTSKMTNLAQDFDNYYSEINSGTFKKVLRIHWQDMYFNNFRGKVRKVKIENILSNQNEIKSNFSGYDAYLLTEAYQESDQHSLTPDYDYCMRLLSNPRMSNELITTIGDLTQFINHYLDDSALNEYMQGLLSRIDGRVVFPMVMALHNKNN